MMENKNEAGPDDRPVELLYLGLKEAPEILTALYGITPAAQMRIKVPQRKKDAVIKSLHKKS